MKTTTVKQKVHIVEYYKDNELMKSIDLAEVIDERKYWENLIIRALSRLLIKF